MVLEKLVNKFDELRDICTYPLFRVLKINIKETVKTVNRTRKVAGKENVELLFIYFFWLLLL